MSDTPYTPIDCSLHDRIESAATLRQPVHIIYLDPDETRYEIDDLIVDVFAKNGEEFIKTDDNVLIRLDRLISVDGVDYK